MCLSEKYISVKRSNGGWFSWHRKSTGKVSENET